MVACLVLDHTLPSRGLGIPVAAIGAVGVWAIRSGVRQHHPRSTAPWGFLAASVAAGTLAIAVQRAAGRAGVDLPLASHVLLLLADFTLLLAILLFARARMSVLDRTELLDVGVIAFATAMAAKTFIVDGTDVPPGMPRLVQTMYVLVVVALAVLLVRVAAFPGRRGFALWLLVGSQMLTVGTTLPSSLGWLPPGHVDLALALSLAAVPIVLAALQPSMVELTEVAPPGGSLTWLRLGGVGLALTIAPLTAVAQNRWTGHAEWAWIVLPAVAITVAVLFRMRILFERERAAREELEAGGEALRALLQGLSDVIFVVEDASGTISFVSESCGATLGRPAEDLLGCDIGDVLATGAWPDPFPLLAASAGGRAACTIHTLVDGARRWFDVTVVDRTEHDLVTGWVIVLHDVTEREQIETSLRHQSLHDTLTGLANRAQLGLKLDEAGLTNAPVAALFVDLDDFKLVNDRFGHHVGDEVLCVIAERLRSTVRDVDVVARLGGDEFCVLIFDGDEQIAIDAGERMLEALRRPIAVCGQEFTVSASIGISAGAPQSDLLQRADAAMYRAKTNGKRVVVLDRSLDGAGHPDRRR
jgi:diguanylate cyclase (GGDEF)-like protein/PAS domain S-box-containing protein